MENFQMFFPRSSSSSPEDPLATNFMQAFNKFHGAITSSSPSDGGRGFVRNNYSGVVNNVVPNIRAQVKEVSEDVVKYEKKAEKKSSRKPRFAFQTRSQVDILDDGYRWRKYGQKAVKNNKFPRSYYRCTNQGCNVKKQVQRLTIDEGVVVTTYEGMHTHPIDKPTDNFEHILSQMQVYTPF